MGLLIAPGWIVAALSPDPPTRVNGFTFEDRWQGFNSFDWLRDHADWHDVLDRHDWQVHSVGGGDVYYTRPDKAVRDGKSAVLHDGGPLVVFSTEVPEVLEKLGHPTTDGTGFSVSIVEFVCAYEFNGDMAMMGRAIADRVGPNAGRVAVLAGNPPGKPSTPERAVTVVDTIDDITGDTTSPEMNLPDNFWRARPVLDQIRQAAWAAGCSPDALFVQALARVATFVHPCFKLPGVEQGLIGKPQTLDFLGCVVAETSGGKTLAAGVAELLVPAPDPPGDGSDPSIDFDQKVGSGEGIAEFFLVPELAFDDDGKAKPTGRRVIGKQALFMNVDEGTGFTSQAGRKGTTIIATLASAWSGEGIGQLNASDETRRLIRGGRVRICAVINMQDSNGYKLYTDDLESVGFTGRLMFATAHDPAAPTPDDAPQWPGELCWPVRAANLSGPVFFTYAPEIVAEIKMTRHGILTRRVRIERRQSQYLLLRCKVAALLAVLDGRLHVTVEDWRLATVAITCSASVLGNLDRVHSAQLEVTAVTAAAFKMKVAESAEAQHRNRLAVGWKPRVLDRLRSRGPQPWKGLKDLVDQTRRSDLRLVVNEMVAEGILELTDGTYRIRR